MGSDEVQSLIQTTVLCRMLIETLERTHNAVPSDEFMVELRDLSEQARAHLASLRAPAAG